LKRDKLLFAIRRGKEKNSQTVRVDGRLCVLLGFEGGGNDWSKTTGPYRWGRQGGKRKLKLPPCQISNQGELRKETGHWKGHKFFGGNSNERQRKKQFLGGGGHN